MGIETIDLNKYNFKYEMQCIDFWISILKPYILFRSHGLGGFGIFKTSDDDPEEKIEITNKVFINFIQYTFSEIIHKELNSLRIEKEEEYLKGETFIYNFNSHGGRMRGHDYDSGYGPKKLINCPFETSILIP